MKNSTIKMRFCPCQRRSRALRLDRHKVLIILQLHGHRQAYDIRDTEPWRLFDGLGFQRRSGLAYLLLFPVLAYPGFPALARRSIPARKRQRRYIGIGDLLPWAAIARHNPHKAALQRSACGAVENISFDCAAIFTRDGHVTAIIEGGFECSAHLFVGGQFRYPALHGSLGKSRRYFQLFRIHGGVRPSLSVALGVTFSMTGHAHAWVSSI